MNYSTRRRAAIKLVFLSAALLPPLSISAQTFDIPIGDFVLRQELILDSSDVTNPVLATHAGDGSGRLFVVDQFGKVSVLVDDQKLPDPFINLSSELNAVGPRGLLGMAFHPQFAETDTPGFRKLYTFHTTSILADADFPSAFRAHQNVVTEWQVDAANPNQVDLSTRREVLRSDNPNAFHSGGMMAFGPDGYLYLALGDGGCGSCGQLVTSKLASIFRIDPVDPTLTPASEDLVSDNGKYRNPIDNPYVDAEGLDEMFVSGVRNPWRFSFDRELGTMIGGDVGEGTREEINVYKHGGNYGWSYYEGTVQVRPPQGGPFEFPIAEYDHSEGVAVTGGYVYRGTQFPMLEGKYIFGDLTQSPPGEPFTLAGRMFYMDIYDESNEVKDPSEIEIREFDFTDGEDSGNIIVGFGENEAGELYYMGGGFFRKIVAAFWTGDFDENGRVDGDDFLLWQAGFGSFAGEAIHTDGDANGDGIVNGDDFLIWQSQFGLPEASSARAIPEPASAGLIAIVCCGLAVRRPRLPRA